MYVKSGARLCCRNFNWRSFWKSKRRREKHAYFTLNRKRIGKGGFKWGPNRELSPWEASMLFSPDISDRPLTMWISQQGRLPGGRSGYLKVVKHHGTTYSDGSKGNVACYTFWSTRLTCVLGPEQQRWRPLPNTLVWNNTRRRIAKKKKKLTY